MALSAPAQAGDQLQPADIENHTLVIIPTQFHPNLPTVHSKAGEDSPAIEAHVVDFSDPSGQPVLYRGVIWWNVVLVNGLKRQIGQTILGRMVKGTAQSGKNAPWQLADVMSEASWVQYAEQFLASPVGAAFELEGQNMAGAGPAVVAPAAAQASPPPPPPAVPAGPPVNQAPPAAPAAPPAAPAVPADPPASTPAPAGDLAAQLSGLPADELAKMMAAIQNQAQAAH